MDVLYILGNGSPFYNDELKYSLRTLERFGSNIDRLILVGEKPSFLNYDKVVLFGPTNAKTEFFNYLSEDHRFVKIKIYIKETDKMNSFQRQNFINDYFSSPLYK